MAEKVGGIEYTVDVDTRATIEAAQKFDAAMDQVQKTADQADATMRRLTGTQANLKQQITQTTTTTQKLTGSQATMAKATAQAATTAQTLTTSATSMAGATAQSDAAAQKLTTSMTGLAKGIAAAVIGMGMLDVAREVQAYKTMSERVKMATADMGEFEMVQARLLETANGTYRSLSEAQEVYIRTSDSLRGMGYSTAEALDIVDSLSYSFVANGASADRAANALQAMTLATTRGKVAVEQWMSITSAVPSIIEDIAEASGKSAGEIRALGAAGQLTAKDLTEGLRKSLEKNSEAAGNMASDLIDAGTRAKTAITAIAAGVEAGTGGLQALTDGIIMAANAVSEFAGDASSMESLIDGIGVAATATAAVIGGRLVGAFATYITTEGKALLATVARIQTEKRMAEAMAHRAQLELQAARAATATAAAQEKAARGTFDHARALGALAAAQDRQAAASMAARAAQHAANNTMTAGALAANGLKAAMAFLGGPVGVIMIAAAALYSFAGAARQAKVDSDALEKSVDKMGQAALRVQARDLADDIAKFADKANDVKDGIEVINKQIEAYTRIGYAEGVDLATRRLDEQRAKLEELDEAQAQRLKRQKEIAAELEKRANPQTEAPAEAPAGPERSEGGSKAIDKLQKQIELTKQLDEHRRRLLAAQQALDDDATGEERQRVAELTTELYRLEEAQKANKEAAKAREEASKAAAAEAEKDAEKARQGHLDNARTVDQLREALYQTTLTADQLRDRQVELSLNSYATPEQIADAQQLAAELDAAQQAAAELKKRQDAFASGVAVTIKGDVQPLSGGAFDDQIARYEAEAQAENERYTAQLERLKEAKEIELEAIGGYQALEEEMAATHAARLEQIELARVQAVLATTEQGFGAVTDVMRMAFGEQSGAYKAALTVQRAANIAQAIMAINTGIALAAANPFPANLAAMASVASATAGLISNIKGARRFGGGVDAGGAYRVGEGNRPEIYQNNLGQSYMIPGDRGRVISNSDLSGGGSRVTVTIHNAPPGSRAQESQGPNGEQVIDVWLADFYGDGRTATAVKNRFGLAAMGR